MCILFPLFLIILMLFSMYFRTNFPRLCVLRVCQQSGKHLDKILTVDEFVKRIYSVIHSNDPVKYNENRL